MDSVREGEGGKIWENGIETCKISCMKQKKKKKNERVGSKEGENSEGTKEIRATKRLKRHLT